MLDSLKHDFRRPAVVCDGEHIESRLYSVYMQQTYVHKMPLSPEGAILIIECAGSSHTTRLGRWIRRALSWLPLATPSIAILITVVLEIVIREKETSIGLKEGRLSQLVSPCCVPCPSLWESTVQKCWADTVMLKCATQSMQWSKRLRQFGLSVIRASKVWHNSRCVWHTCQIILNPPMNLNTNPDQSLPSMHYIGDESNLHCKMFFDHSKACWKKAQLALGCLAKCSYGVFDKYVCGPRSWVALFESIWIRLFWNLLNPAGSLVFDIK